MTVWVVRAGRNGEREEKALSENLCFIGWGHMPDLASFKNKDEIRQKLDEVYPDAKSGRILNHAGQLFNFLKGIKKGDIIALPLKNRPAIAFGEIIEDKYIYSPDNPQDARHSRAVKWIGEPILRSRLDQDLIYSFGASQTVFTIHRNDAEKRIRKMLSKPYGENTSLPESLDDSAEPKLNIISTAAQRISDVIGQRFKGKAMENLVAAILQAKGYETDICPDGPDGGVDILAGRGAMGFESPRLCVQVKSGDSTVGREILDQLQGNIHKFKADYGLLVSWGGFKPTVTAEARRNFFQIKLWNDQKLVQEIQDHYDDLPPEIQSVLPLQRTWVLIEDDDVEAT